MESADDPRRRIDGAVERERRFYDERAALLNPAAMPPREFAWNDTVLENAILEPLGAVEGARVLDLCCGEGDLSLRLLQRGAAVTALDVSPGLVDVAHRRQEIFVANAPAAFVVAEVEDTGLDSNAFDFVVGKFALHHLDLGRAAAEIARVLSSGGRGVFIETSGLSPPLNFARRRLLGRRGVIRVGTQDESPLGREDLRVLAAHFTDVELDFPSFTFFELFNRHVIKRPRTHRLTRRLDRWVQRRVPVAHRWSYQLRIQLRP